jgi:hypothetical protein
MEKIRPAPAASKTAVTTDVMMMFMAFSTPPE